MNKNLWPVVMDTYLFFKQEEFETGTKVLNNQQINDSLDAELMDYE